MLLIQRAPARCRDRAVEPCADPFLRGCWSDDVCPSTRRRLTPCEPPGCTSSPSAPPRSSRCPPSSRSTGRRSSLSRHERDRLPSATTKQTTDRDPSPPGLGQVSVWNLASRDCRDLEPVWDGTMRHDTVTCAQKLMHGLLNLTHEKKIRKHNFRKVTKNNKKLISRSCNTSLIEFHPTYFGDVRFSQSPV